MKLETKKAEWLMAGAKKAQELVGEREYDEAKRVYGEVIAEARKAGVESAYLGRSPDTQAQHRFVAGPDARLQVSLWLLSHPGLQPAAVSSEEWRADRRRDGADRHGVRYLEFLRGRRQFLHDTARTLAIAGTLARKVASFGIGAVCALLWGAFRALLAGMLLGAVVEIGK